MKHKKEVLHDDFQEGFTWKGLIVPIIALIISILAIICAFMGNCYC